MASAAWQCKRSCARISAGLGACAGAARMKQTSATLADGTHDKCKIILFTRDRDARSEAVCS